MLGGWVAGRLYRSANLLLYSAAGETEALAPKPLPGFLPNPSFTPQLLSFNILSPGRKNKKTQTS